MATLFISTWNKSPQYCKDELIEIAKKNQLNYIEFDQIKKTVFTNSNYKYTMHSYSAFIGISAKKRHFIEEKKAIESTKNYYSEFDDVSVFIKRAIKKNEEKRDCQTNFIYSIYVLFKNLFKFLFRLK